MPGVTDIQTSVEDKTVVVEADAAVSPADMLEKLQKVCVSRHPAVVCCWRQEPQLTLFFQNSGVRLPGKRSNWRPNEAFSLVPVDGLEYCSIHFRFNVSGENLLIVVSLS
jgi:hypothetical protein